MTRLRETKGVFRERDHPMAMVSAKTISSAATATVNVQRRVHASVSRGGLTVVDGDNMIPVEAKRAMAKRDGHEHQRKSFDLLVESESRRGID
jgi:hypothetical protein